MGVGCRDGCPGPHMIMFIAGAALFSCSVAGMVRLKREADQEKREATKACCVPSRDVFITIDTDEMLPEPIRQMLVAKPIELHHYFEQEAEPIQADLTKRESTSDTIPLPAQRNNGRFLKLD